MSARTVKFIALVFFIVAALFLAHTAGALKYLDQERLRLWIEGYGVWGPLVYILIYSIAPVFMVPGLPITVAGGVLFGTFWGVVYVMIGATVGATLAFLTARYLGRGWVEDAIRGRRLEELDREVERQGWKIVAFTRLIPVFPFNFVNFAFGLTKIRFSHYIIATFIFIFPGVVAYVVFSSSLPELFKGRVTKEFVIGAILLVVVSAIPFLYRRFGKKTR